MNKLYFGDNLAVMRAEIKDASIDLVYLDPPFNSNATYNLIHKSPVGKPTDAQKKAFKDTWRWEEDAAAEALDQLRESDLGTFRLLCSLRDSLGTGGLITYLVMMSIRLVELRRVLKPTGSLYLHCDTSAAHYLKVVLDKLFGERSFQNEITWKRTSAHNDPHRYGRVQDRILFYSKGAVKTFHPKGGEFSEEQLARYRYVDDKGHFKAENLTAPHLSQTRSMPWRGVSPGADRQWRFSPEELDRLWSEGRILTRKDGAPRKDGLKEYLEDCEEPVLQDLWTDIKRIGNTSKERLGYPTQKPVALLKRIVEASSNPGDLILDPFCGCGTTIHAAEQLGRSWIGIDVAYDAILVIEDRLKTWLPAASYTVAGIPTVEREARALAKLDPHQFQAWAVGRLGGRSRGKGADRGIDGEIAFKVGRSDFAHAVVSVKAGQNVNPAMVRELAGVVRREEALAGIFVCLDEPTREMRIEASRSDYVDLPGGRRHAIQIVTAADLIRGPDIGIGTQLNTITAAEAAREQERKKPVKRPSAEDLRREPPLPPMGIGGGKAAAKQQALDLNEPLLTAPTKGRKRKAS